MTTISKKMLLLLFPVLLMSCSEESHKAFYAENKQTQTEDMTVIRNKINNHIKTLSNIKIQNSESLHDLSEFQKILKEYVTKHDKLLEYNYKKQLLEESYDQANTQLNEEESKLFNKVIEETELFLLNNSYSSANSYVLEKLSNENSVIKDIVTIPKEEQVHYEHLLNSLQLFNTMYQLTEIISSINVINLSDLTLKNYTKQLKVLPKESIYKKQIDDYTKKINQKLLRKTKKESQKLFNNYTSKASDLYKIKLKFDKQKNINSTIKKLDSFSKKTFKSELVSSKNISEEVSTSNVDNFYNSINSSYNYFNAITTKINLKLDENYKRKELKKSLLLAKNKHYDNQSIIVDYFVELQQKVNQIELTSSSNVYIIEKTINCFTLIRNTPDLNNRKTLRKLKKTAKKVEELKIKHFIWRIKENQRYIKAYLNNPTITEVESQTYYDTPETLEKEALSFLNYRAYSIYEKEIKKELSALKKQLKN